MNGFSSGERGVFELTGADGEVVHVNADDVINLANGRLADIGYGAAATQGTVRHETFHSLWRFVRGTMKDEEVQALAKTFGIDVTKKGWERNLDETMAPQMERYASGHYVAHAVSEKFDRLMNGWAGKFLGFIGRLGPQDEVTDPKTGKPYQLKGLYDAILRGELGSGALGVELRKVPQQTAEPTATPKSSMPVEVTDADRAEAEAEMRGEAVDENQDGEGKLVHSIQIGQGLSHDEAKSRLDELRGKEYKNVQSGIVARLSANGAGKLISNAAVAKTLKNGFTAQQHNELAANIDKLFAEAVLVESRPDRDGDVNVKSIKRFAAPVSIEGSEAAAWITVKESVEHGHRIYSVEGIKITALSPTVRRAISGRNSADNAETPRSVPQTSTEVKATAENPADASVPNQRFYKVGLPNSPVKLVGRLEVRDAETGVITSTDADYHDRGNQNRDDKSEESRALVQKIGANPDPLQVGTVQPIASNGVVWMLPNGDVIIGNHRVNGVRLGYAKGTTAELEKFVREDAAKRGIEIGADVKKPLLVFVLERIESPDGKADVHEVVRLANESQNRGFNVREQASNDAKILIDNNLLPRMAFRADGRIDETKSGDAIGKFRQESGAQGMIAEDGSLTEEGQTRIQNAALAALLGGEGNGALLQKIMSNAGRLDMQPELRALMKMTPELVALAEAKPGYDLRAPLAEALQLFTEWRDKDETSRVEKGKTRHDWREMKDGRRVRGLSWDAFMSQGDMFRQPSDEAKILGDLFAKAEQLRSFDREDVESAVGKKRAIDLISGYLADYIANARAVNTDTEDMFGGTPATRAEVMAAQRAAGEGGARFSLSPQAQLEYDEVVARYTNEDGTKKRGWMKAPNGKPTRLNESQWVMVRTPTFKKWFGDWEKAYYTKGWRNLRNVEDILALPLTDISAYAPLQDKEAVKSAFQSFGLVRNAADGMEVRFPAKAAGRFVFVRRYASAFKELFKTSLRAWSEDETRFEGHKEHRNIEDYHHYVNRFKTPDGEYFVRFTVRSGREGAAEGKHLIHAANVSAVEIYKNEAAQTEYLDRSATSLDDGKKPNIDCKISYFLSGVNPGNEDCSKIVDANGEPLVVYRGAAFDPLAQEAGKGVVMPEAYFTADPAYAKRYGNVRAYYLNIRNPFDIRNAKCLKDLKKIYPDHEFQRGESGALDWAEASVVEGEFLKDNFGDKYDGIIYDEGGDPAENEQGYTLRGLSYVPLDGGAQVKSATDNNGDFSGHPDARYSIGGIFTGTAADYANRSRQGGKDDGPSLQKIGTGEGTQVYGWGLYGSNVRGVAEGYARGDVFAKRNPRRAGHFEINGKRLPEWVSDRFLEFDEFGSTYFDGRKPDADFLIDGLKYIIGLKQRAIRFPRAYDNVEEILRQVEENRDGLRFVSETEGNVYEQTFFTDRAPGDESHLLKWYEPASEEQLGWIEKGLLTPDFGLPDGAAEKLKSEVLSRASSLSGGELYWAISNALGSPQAASEFLARAGIDGVKYPVDSYGGKGVKDGDVAGWNYVSFRDDNIRVDHKWTDGQLRYSVAVTPEVRKATTVDAVDMTRDKADAALRALAGRDLKNDETGIVAQVNSVQRRKILSGVAVQKSADNGFSAEEHNAAASIIEKLWKYASLGKVDGDKNGDPFVKSIKRFVSPVRLGDKDAYAYLTVKESNERGHRIYSIELEKLEALARKLGAQSPAAQSASVPEGMPESVPNPTADGKRYSMESCTIK